MSLIPDLELQLRDAASRRRSRANRRVVGWLATASVVAALAAGLVIASGGERRSDDQPPAGKGRHLQPLPVGTVIRKGEGSPPRDSDATVVATGTAPVAGPWQLEVWRDHGGPFPPGEPRGRCLFIILLDPPTYRDGTRDPSGASGFCGGLGFRKTPGFSRAQRNVPTLRKAPRGPMKGGREILVFGRVPERARKVVITEDRGRPRRRAREHPRGLLRDPGKAPSAARADQLARRSRRSGEPRDPTDATHYRFVTSDPNAALTHGEASHQTTLWLGVRERPLRARRERP
jgi:hypothetical protein